MPRHYLLAERQSGCFLFHPARRIHFPQAKYYVKGRSRDHRRIDREHVRGQGLCGVLEETRDIFNHCPVVFHSVALVVKAMARRLSNSESRSKSYDWDAAVITILRILDTILILQH